MGGDHRAILRRHRGGELDGSRQHVRLGSRVIHDAACQRLVGGEPSTRHHGVVRGDPREAGGHDRLHRYRQRQSEVDLGQAPVAPVGAHHAGIEATGQHRATGERMAVDRSHRVTALQDQTTEQPMHVGHERTRLVGVRGHPVEVEPVGEEAPVAADDQREAVITPVEVVEQAVPCIDRGTVVAVLRIPPAHQHHITHGIDLEDHRSILPAGLRAVVSSRPRRGPRGAWSPSGSGDGPPGHPRARAPRCGRTARGSPIRRARAPGGRRSASSRRS